MFSKHLYLSHCVNKHLLSDKIFTSPKEKLIIHMCHIGIGYGNGKTTTYPDQRRQRMKMRSYGCAPPVPDFCDDYRKTLNPLETRQGSPFDDSSSPY